MTSRPLRVPAHQPALTLSARSPEDLLAAVPVVLGFEPARSIVLLTFGGAETFHARVDLPPPDRERDLEEVVAALLGPTRRHAVQAVVFVLYTDDPAEGHRVGHRLRRRFQAAGVRVLEVLRTDGRRWHLLDRRRGVPADGVPYDLGSHRFRAQAVVDGLVTLRSREELATLLMPDEIAARQVLALVPSARPPDPDAMADLVAAHLAAGAFPDEVLAGVLPALADRPTREAAWTTITRGNARDHVELWSDAVRRSPEELSGWAAAVLGFACWVAGQGALAWCAVDRSLAVDPGNSLAELVADALQHAISPATIEESPP